MKKLLSTAEFVLWLEKDNETCDISKKRGYIEFKSMIINYAELMLCPLDFDTVKKYFEEAKHHKAKRFWGIIMEDECIKINGHWIWYKKRKHTFWGKYGWYWVTKARTIEELAKEIDLTPSKTLLKEIGLK